ncbi:MAG TPA: phage tail tube protein [Candidatus Dormibacteraeota bacterium]|nr:phage tail tube protein [Candidatus Dormibacteraeota bacterium]
MAVSLAQVGYGTLLQRAGVTVLEVLKVGGPGMKADMKEVSNMLSPNTYKEFIAGLREGGDVTFEINYVPKDATQITLRQDLEGGVNSSWTIVLPGALGTWTFNAFVMALSPAYPLDDRIVCTGTLRITGKPLLT